VSADDLEELLHRGVLHDSERVNNYINRFSMSKPAKLLRDDIKDPSGFERHFGLKPGQIADLPEQSIVAHSLYRSWNEINLEIMTRYQFSVRNDFRAHLENAQGRGMANLLTMIRSTEMTGYKHSPQTLLDYFNAAASLDGPADPFSRLPLTHPAVLQGMRLDWQMIKGVVRLLDKEMQFRHILAEGDEAMSLPVKR
jgi:hypothetical protein